MPNEKKEIKLTEDQAAKMIYNVELGREAIYVLEVDKNGEILAQCTETSDFLKFPNVSEEEIDALIEKHNEESVTQVKRKPLFAGQKIK